MTARNLMPPALAVVSIGVGVWALHRPVSLVVVSMLGVWSVYVVRMAMRHRQMDRESARLLRRNRDLEALAAQDALTGVGNRRSLETRYAHLARAATETGTANPCALLLVDVDNLKQANDHFGHLHGDKVLVAVAEVLRMAAARVPGSHCARFGGDEFALLLPGADEAAGARAGWAIRDAVAARRVEVAGNGVVSVSVGGAVAADAAAMGLEELIGGADRALYRAKVSGRNRVEMDGAVMELRAAG